MHYPLAQYRSLLGQYLRPQQSKVVLLAALLAGSIGLQLLSPQVIRYFLDTAQTGGAEQALIIAALLFIAIGLTQRAMALASVFVGENIGWKATNSLRADLTRHCLRLDMSFHKSHRPGELIERIDGDVTSLANFFSQFVVHVAGNALLVLSILLLLLIEDWRVGVGLAIYTAITVAILSAIQHLAVRRWSAERQARAEQFGFLEEHFAATEDLRANGAEEYALRRLYQLTRDLLYKNRAARLVSNLTFVTTNGLFVLGYTLGLALGAYLYTSGQATIGTAYLIVFYIGMLSGPLERIREQIQDLQQATASIRRIQELLSIRRRVSDGGSNTLTPGALGVTFDQVSFRYADDEQRRQSSVAEEEALVLQQLSFDLPPGQVLGLLGRTGSGKTTLTRLLFRLYDPTTGSIRLAGSDLRDLALADLRGRVAMVTQDVQLFQASIRENLTLFDPGIDDTRLRQALNELGLWEWVQSQPQGLDTRLASGGHGLSAGEAQLLAFARIFLKDPGLIILDEASSRLDPATERLLERAIDRLLAGRTAIIIAHRLQTVQRADAILILEQGQVVEYGPRSRLAGDPGSRFATLLRSGLEEALA